jgi:hypothetical protein
VAPYSEEELVLCGREAGFLCLALAPALKAPEAGPKGEKASVGAV